MTVRQQKMIANLDRQLVNNEPISIHKAAKEAGYSKNYAGKAIYKDIGKPSNPVCKWVSEYVGRDKIFKDIRELEKDCKTAEDRSTRARMIELRAKIGKLDQQQTQVNIFQGFTSSAADAMLNDVDVIDVGQGEQGQGA